LRPTWETVAKLSLNLYRKAVAALEQCVATKPVLGILQEGGASFQTTHGTEILHARQTELSTQSAEARDTCPSMGRRSARFLSETRGAYEWKKNLMLAAIHLIKVSAVVFAVSALSFGVGFLRASSHAETHAPSSQPNADPNWTELVASMDKMHRAMEAVEYSGNSDFDFVRLMLPHHQAAVDMAKTQLLRGKDTQMRRLAQEIITDQQLEIELMQLWLKQHELAEPKERQTTTPATRKDNKI
jgi:Domain of unknown function (DUF305)